MQLYCYDDYRTQGLHMSPYLRGRRNLLSVGDIESQPIFLSVFHPPIDACIQIVVLDDATKSAILGRDAIQLLEIANESQRKLVIRNDASQYIYINPDGSVILKLSAMLPEAVLIVDNDADQVLHIQQDGMKTLEIQQDADKTLREPSKQPEVIVEIGPDAITTLVVEEPCE